ncbi:MAG: hypothetical protein ACT4PT_10820 [Methanobacteriota archaeon]
MTAEAAGDASRGVPEWPPPATRSRGWRLVFLFIPPLILAPALYLHPGLGYERFPDLDFESAHRFITVHLVGLAAFPLMGYAAALLLDGLRSAVSHAARAALAAYAVLYASMDSLYGIGRGFEVLAASTMSREAVLAARPVLFAVNDSGVAAWLYLAAGLAWLVGCLLAAAALLRSGAPLLPLPFLAGSGAVLFWYDHPGIEGVAFCGLFVVAAALVEASRGRVPGAPDLEVVLEIPRPAAEVRAWWTEMPADYRAADPKEQPHRIVTIARNEDRWEIDTHWRGPFGRDLVVREVFWFRPDGWDVDVYAPAGIRQRDEFRLEATPQGTRVQIRVQIRGTGLAGRLAAPIYRAYGRRNFPRMWRHAARLCARDAPRLA